jgi:hypothetical protein
MMQHRGDRMTYDFSELKRVQFSDLVALTIPARWNVETRPNFDWFCTERDEESGSVTVVVDPRKRVEGARDADIDLENVVRDMAAQISSRFGDKVLESTIAEFQHGYVHKYVSSFDDEEGTLRSYRYTLVQHHDGILAFIFVVLVIVEADAERSDMRKLIGIIEKSVHDIELLLYSNRRIPLPELRELQTITCGSALSLRVPARWDLWVNHNDDEGWGCYRRGEESGTLWIAINRFRRPSPAEQPNFSLRSYLDHMVDSRLKSRDAPLFDSKISEIDGGYLWCFDFRTEEDGDDLHYFRHVFVTADDTEVAIVIFGLVLLSTQLQDPSFRGLVAIMDREVRAAKLTVLSEAARSTGSVAFPFPEAFCFDDKVHINLPGFIKVSPQGDGRSLYCSFPPDITASMWIMISDHKLSDNPFEDDGTISPDIFSSLERHFADDLHEEAVIARLPRGFILYAIYDDEDLPEDEIDDPTDRWKRFGFRHHVWRYFHIGTKIVCQVQFMLMLPVREPDKRELKSLVMTLDREIRKAQFPKLN